MGILALDQAHDANDFESEVARRFDGINCRSSSRANVVDDHDFGTRLAEAFDALSSPVLLLRFADQKTVQRPAGNHDGDDDGIGTQRKSANGAWLPALLVDFVEENLAGELRAAGIERSGTAVDVIVAGQAGRQLEIAQAKRFAGQHLQKLLAGSGHEFLRYQWAVVSDQWADESGGNVDQLTTSH